MKFVLAKRTLITFLVLMFGAYVSGSLGTVSPGQLQENKDSVFNYVQENGCSSFQQVKQDLDLSERELKLAVVHLQEEEFQDMENGVLGRPKILMYDCGLARGDKLVRSNRPEQDFKQDYQHNQYEQN